MQYTNVHYGHLGTAVHLVCQQCYCEMTEQGFQWNTGLLAWEDIGIVVNFLGIRLGVAVFGQTFYLVF